MPAPRGPGDITPGPQRAAREARRATKEAPGVTKEARDVTKEAPGGARGARGATKEARGATPGARGGVQGARLAARGTSPPGPLSKKEGELVLVLVYRASTSARASPPSFLERGPGGEVSRLASQTTSALPHLMAQPAKLFFQSKKALAGPAGALHPKARAYRLLNILMRSMFENTYLFLLHDVTV
jgi:hypothetical protein